MAEDVPFELEESRLRRENQLTVPYGKARRYLESNWNKLGRILEKVRHRGRVPLYDKLAQAVERIDTGRYPFQFFSNRVLLTAFNGLRLTDLVRIRHDVPKGGSLLSVLYDVVDEGNPLNGVVINTIRKENSDVWKALSSGSLRAHGDIIPVAPVLLREDGSQRVYPLGNEKGKVRVYSRFCGINCGEIINFYETAVKNEPEIRADNIAQWRDLVQTIDSQTHKIRSQLSAADVIHGHDWSYNFTVEFIERSYFNGHLAHGGNVNDITYKKENWSFDPDEYIKNPERWCAVVRLIDFDHASFRTRRSPDENGIRD
ncbi:hypothetical protein FJZ40_02970 [Candidatus Shapirobacteria bacterium]|nr:hypothetical protein [Candidatus Shapirobacteria bacterium]